MRVVVTGAGGAIGGWLMKDLRSKGHEVRGVDIKPIREWWQTDPSYRSSHVGSTDLMLPQNCDLYTRKVDWIYHLACPMGGIGWITEQRYQCARSATMTTHMLDAAVKNGAERFFLSSSACAYSAIYQQETNSPALAEHMAWPAEPEEGYGLSKLFEEKLCQYAQEDTNIETRVARFHNVYSPYGSYEGGKEKAPAAICRKVAEAVLSGRNEIDIWGDGQATRSFMWIDDCLKGINFIMNCDYSQPVNLGSSEMVSVNQLVDIVEQIAGVSLKRNYDPTKPQGVRGRNSDNTLIQELYNWQPDTPLVDGLERLYAWIFDKVKG